MAQPAMLDKDQEKNFMGSLGDALSRGNSDGPIRLYVVLRLDASHIALSLDSVERVVQAVELTPLPGAPEIVLGLLNLQGRVIPTFDLRRRFGLPLCAMAPSDQIVVARTRRRAVALLADAVVGVSACPEAERIDARDILPGLALIAGVVRREDGLLLVHDLERFLSLDEAAQLDDAMAAGRRA